MIVRPVYWQGILGHLQALPRDGLPITDPDWHTLDRALYNVTEGIRIVVEQLDPKPVSAFEVLPYQASKGESADGSHTVPIKTSPFSQAGSSFLVTHPHWAYKLRCQCDF